MLESDDMKPTNRVVLNGIEIESIGFNLETLDNASQSCTAIRKTLGIIDTLQFCLSGKQEQFYGRSEIEEFINDRWVISGLTAALSLVSAAISEAEENIANVINDKLLVQGEDQKSYQYLYRRGQKGQDLEKLPIYDFF